MALTLGGGAARVAEACARLRASFPPRNHSARMIRSRARTESPPTRDSSKLNVPISEALPNQEIGTLRMSYPASIGFKPVSRLPRSGVIQF